MRLLTRRDGGTVEGVIWLIVGIAALATVLVMISKQQKTEPPKVVEIMKVAKTPDEVKPLVEKWLKKNKPGSELVNMGVFGTIRGQRYVGAKIQTKNAEGQWEGKPWVFTGEEDEITIGESADEFLKKLQQESERTKNWSSFQDELLQLRKMSGIQ